MRQATPVPIRCPHAVYDGISSQKPGAISHLDIGCKNAGARNLSALSRLVVDGIDNAQTSKQFPQGDTSRSPWECRYPDLATPYPAWRLAWPDHLRRPAQQG